MSKTLVKFVAVGRLVKKDGAFVENQHQVIASLAADKDDPALKNYKNHVKQIMNKGAPKLKPNKRIKLTSDSSEYDLHVMADTLNNSDENIIVFFAVTDVELGKAHSVAKLLEELKTTFYGTNDADSILNAKAAGEVNKKSQTLLKSIVTKYGSNKIADVQAKVDEVKDIMQDNVNRTLENVEKLEDLESKAETIDHQARQFEKGAGGVRSVMRWKYFKMTAIIVVIVALLLTVIFVPVAMSMKKK